MSRRFFLTRVLPTFLFICVVFPSRGSAQIAVGLGVGPGWYGPRTNGYAYGRYNRYPYPPPYWNYPGLAGGPYVTPYYPYYGWPGYTGRIGSFWTNGLSLYGPPVPVYGPIPGVLGNSELNRQWHDHPTLGLGVGVYGWVGPFRASPRPYPLSVNPWPAIESIDPIVGEPAARQAPGVCLHLSVKVPQASAEVFVDGVKTVQTGLDRIYESPPLEAGKDYTYEITARWIEGGATVERKKTVIGKPGEVVRVDLTIPGK